MKVSLLFPLLLVTACQPRTFNTTNVASLDNPCFNLNPLPPDGLAIPPNPTHAICPLVGPTARAPVHGKDGCQFPENQGGWAKTYERVGYDPANRTYRREFKGKAWEWVYFYTEPKGWAYVAGEDLVRLSDGGCTARYNGANGGEVVPPPAPAPAPAVPADPAGPGPAPDLGGIPNHGAQLLPGFDYCEATWEERPGYADYTTRDRYLESVGRSRTVAVDRAEAATLQGNSRYQSLSFCDKAKVLSKCFWKVTEKGNSPEAVKFRDWARNRAHPLELHIAFSMQETKMGTLTDTCSGGTCNGVGLVQIITAIAPGGGTLSSTDPKWSNITHNILTNINYSVRVLWEKASQGATNIHSLARLYNGHPAHMEQYAQNVAGFYEDVKACNIRR